MDTKKILTALFIILMSVTASAQKTELKPGETLNPDKLLFSKDGKWALSGRWGQFATFSCNNFTFERKGRGIPKVELGRDTGKTQKLILTANSVSVNDYRDGGMIKGRSQGSPTFKYTKLIVENDGTISIYGSDGKTQIQMMHIKSSSDL